MSISDSVKYVGVEEVFLPFVLTSFSDVTVVEIKSDKSCKIVIPLKIKIGLIIERKTIQGVKEENFEMLLLFFFKNALKEAEIIICSKAIIITTSEITPNAIN